MSFVTILMTWVGLNAAIPAAAQDPPRRPFELAASLGCAAPVGWAERGSRVSDTTFADVPFALDAGYRITRFLGVVANVRYGVAIPTLCRSASDCESSLGNDVALEIAARLYVPHIGPVAGLVDAGVGYEWLTTRLVDASGTSARAYRGPELFSIRIAAPFRLGARWTLGPVVGASFGTFTTYSLETNALSPSGDVPARAVHAWLSVGIRMGFSL
jgi:hypothetical protein